MHILSTAISGIYTFQGSLVKCLIMGVDWERLRRVLGQNTPPADLIYTERCKSTNDLVRQHFSEPGSLNIILACTDYQEHGRGVHGHSWSSPGSSDALFTLGFRPDALGYTVDPRLPLCAGVLIQRTIRIAFGIVLRCKWPNDLVTNDGRKAGGILVLNNAGYVAIGVGLNVNSLPVDYPEDLRGKVITLREIFGHEIDRTLLYLVIIPELLKHIAGTPGYTCDDLINLWSDCAKGLGYPMKMVVDSKTEVVTPARINRLTGELIVIRQDGDELALSSADYIET